MAKKRRPHVANPPVIKPVKVDNAFLRSDLVSAAALFCLTLIAYFPSLRGELLWDDAGHVTRPELQSLHGLWRIWSELGATQQYYPLLHSAFWLEHRLWGDAASGYHLTNVVLHAVAALLVVLIVRRLSLPGAWLAGFLFAVHPVCVEAVAWIAEQKTTLSTVFYLLSLLVYLRYDESRRPLDYLLAFLLFLPALMTKTVTATLPAAILVILWAQRGRLAWRRDVLPLVPWLAIGVAGGLFTAWVERHYIGADGSDFALTAVDRVLLSGRVIWFYLDKVIWPANLIFIYPRWTLDAAVWWQYVFPIGILLLAWALWKLAPRQRVPLAGFCFFAGTLFPVLGFFNVYPFIYSYVADHFQYVASLGVIVPLSAGLVLFAKRVPPSGRAVTAAALITVLTILTWNQCKMYRDSQTLFTEVLARNPTAWMAHNNLGRELLQIPGRQGDGMVHFEKALQIKPDSAVAHYDLGIVLESMPGRTLDAISEYQAALRSNPNYVDARAALGLALSKIPGRLPEAIEQYEAGLRISPNSMVLHRRLGDALLQVPGRSAEAMAELAKVSSAEPGQAEAHFDLANALAEAPNQSAPAIAEYQAALSIRPDYAAAHLNLGSVLSRMPGRTSDAIAEYQAALRIQPHYPEAHFNLGTLLSDIPGRTSDAIAEYQAALRDRPDYAEVHLNLAVALEGIPGRLPDAIAEFQAALRSKPDSAEAHYGLGDALMRVPGRMPEAISHFEAALRIQPDFQPAQEALGRLKKRRP